MTKELVPEIHDLFKMTKYRHDLADFEAPKYEEYIPDTRTWQGIIQHHNPVEPDTFILAIADHLAASLSREKEEIKGEGMFYVYKLWNPPKNKEEIDPRLHKEEDIIELLKFIGKEPTREDYFNKYNQLLKTRTEDAHPGKNITTLYTHCKLTGLFYRILQNSSNFIIEAKEFRGKSPKEIEKWMKKKEEQEWKLFIVRCKIFFPQKPTRVKDLNIFTVIEESIDQIYRFYPNNLFFRSTNEIVMFFADEEELIKAVEKISEKGFRLEIIQTSRPLREITNPYWISSGDWRIKQKSLPEKIEPPICEICQMARATKHWPKDYIIENKDLCNKCKELISQNPLETVFEYLCDKDFEKLLDLKEEKMEENLCESCYLIRSQGTRLKKLAGWAESGSTKVVWIKLTLDLNILADTLESLYIEYLSSLNLSSSREKQIRFPVIMEFQEDYTLFLKYFKEQIIKTFDSENLETISKDFFCLKIQKLHNVLSLLQIYNKGLDEFFPKFKEVRTSPIKFTMICADSKYPFFKIWEIIEKEKNDVLISLIGRGSLKARNKYIEQICLAATESFHKSALYKLAKVAEISEQLAKLTFKDKIEKDYSKIETVLPFGLDFRSILTFAQLLED